MKRVLGRPDRWLMWLIVASLVLPPAFFGLVAYQSRTAAFATADQQLAGTVRLLREHAQKVFDTDELAIEQVDRLTDGMSWDDIARSQALHERLKALDVQLAQVSGVFLVAPDGAVASSSRAFPVPPLNIGDRDYFSAIRDGHKGSLISKVYRGPLSGVQQFNIARRRSSPDGSFNGIILISDSAAYFEDAYRNIGNNAASVILARDDGEELAFYPSPMFSGSRVPADLIAKLPATEPLLVGSVPLLFDASDRRGAYQRINGYPLFVGYSLPTSAITASWFRTVVQNGILVGIGSLTVAFMSWLVLRGFRNERAAHAAFRAEVQRREDAEAKMGEARKMEVVGQLAAGVAHDFNNLLAVISANLERLHKRPEADQKIRVESALSATERGANLIHQMLTFARRQELHPEVLNVNAELKAFAPLLASALKQDIAMDYQLMAEPAVCRIDRAELEFAMLNIATNAGHAMPNGGHIVIDTRRVDVIGRGDGELGLADGTYLRLAVTDTGEGMPPAVLARAFEPFFTTRDAGAGTGLGLSQVYGFATQSGGQATVESVVGRGTTVSMYLPMLERDALARNEQQMADAY